MRVVMRVVTRAGNSGKLAVMNPQIRLVIAFLFASTLLLACRGEASSPALASADELPGQRSLEPSGGESKAANRAEQARLRRHFDTVLYELARADISHLNVAQRNARAGHIAELERYRDRGVFPHNHDFRDARMPYFVDEHGTHCALGHLIQKSGGGELVERIATTRNNAFVAELAADLELVAWLDRAGLSAAEAARIQPAYCPGFPDECRPETEISAMYGTASLVVDLANLASVVMNMRPSGTRRGWFGAVSGMAGLGLGVFKLDKAGEVRTLGAFNAGLGALSLALGIYGIRNSDRPAQVVVNTPLGDVSVQPVVSAGTIGLRGEF